MTMFLFQQSSKIPQAISRIRSARFPRSTLLPLHYSHTLCDQGMITRQNLEIKTVPKPFLFSTERKKKTSFVPLKAPVIMTEDTRIFFRKLLENQNDSDVVGIMLKYNQSSSGEPRMVFSFDFAKKSDIGPKEEPVSLEVLEDGSPKSPKDSVNDGLPKLYVHHNAFMKVLGGKLEVDLDSFKLTIYDREGNVMDPNA
mmetsp:Transcript_17166/g.26011  ORF Transcript_17166/g.26011 Transcript_17166/m.26011 type:complete len:198 (+) Transcript_17166:29-622(+)